MSDVIMYTLYRMYQLYRMRPMATMYTQNAAVVASTKTLYTCATLYPEATMLTKDDAGRHHRLDRGQRGATVEAGGIVARKFAFEREPCDVFLVVADAVCHVLEAPFGHEAEPPCGVALALQLFALAVLHHLALALAKLAQHLDVNTVFPEFLFHIVA